MTEMTKGTITLQIKAKVLLSCKRRNGDGEDYNDVAGYNKKY